MSETNNTTEIIESKDLESKDLESKDLESKDLESKDLESEDPRSEDLESKDPRSEDQQKIKDYKPIITSKYISIYEYARLLTNLSLYIFEKKSLSKYIETIEIKNIIDTNKIAYELLKNGVFDAVIDRGYEKVLFSNLKTNPLYDNMIEEFLEEQEENINKSFLSLLNMIEEN